MEMGGRLDPQVFRELSEKHDLPIHEGAMQAFREVYVARMAHAFEMESWTTALPGAIDLVRTIHEHPRMTGAIMTGNIEPTSWMKILDAGFDRAWFEFGVFGDEAPNRRELPSIARLRHHIQSGELVDPSRIVIIGDTLHDVDCAIQAGCISIAVATGTTSIETLHESRATMVLESLAGIDDLIERIDGL
jgi:phosphoglycolate phosphatase-like HAD superfamily hydrolase